MEAKRRSKLRVASVKLRCFRGVPGEIDVVFGRGTSPTSALIFGGNGSGKSSIVDAIEWALQARVGRLPASNASGNPNIVNLHSTDGRAEVAVVLSDGTSCKRRTSADGVRGDPIQDAFRRVPMSLKRADILRFLDTSPATRGKVFLDHSLDDEPVDQVTINAEHDVRERLLDAKRAAREAAWRLAVRLGVEAPRSLNQIDLMITEHVYKNLPSGLRERAQIPRRIAEHLEEIEAAQRRVKQLNVERNELRRFQDSTAVKDRLRGLHDVLGDVSEWLTHSFLEVTGAQHVERISATFGVSSEIGLDIWVDLANGARQTPQQVFSEGYQDLIGLLYHLSIMRAAGDRGQAHVLILDDVLQSVDAEIRVALMHLIAAEFKNWQLFITVHDRLWRTQLRDVFQRTGHVVADIEVTGWQFSQGPRISSSVASDPAAPLWHVLDSNDPQTVCGVSGRVLEQVCDRLSWTIPLSVKRKRGDAYTLSDLWQGTLKELRATSSAETAAQIDRYIHLRNAAGAHYNEWAEGVAWSDAERLGWAVADLVGQVFCDNCVQWVERRGTHSYACPCGRTAVRPV